MVSTLVEKKKKEQLKRVYSGLIASLFCIILLDLNRFIHGASPPADQRGLRGAPGCNKPVRQQQPIKQLHQRRRWDQSRLRLTKGLPTRASMQTRPPIPARYQSAPFASPDSQPAATHRGLARRAPCECRFLVCVG